MMMLPLLSLPFVSEIQIQGIASGFGTLIGTGIRIPNEVLKQRLQTGQHANVVDAFRSVLSAGGSKALFAGTAATLAREVPFYAFGMVAYEQLKRGAASLSGKELTAWQTIAVGALSGALAAIATTPADVLKTRIMTGRAPPGVSALALATKMAREVLALSALRASRFAPRLLPARPCLGALPREAANAP